MLELLPLVLKMAAACRCVCVTPDPAQWPKASVTLIPPPMAIGIGVRQGEVKKQTTA